MWVRVRAWGLEGVGARLPGIRPDDVAARAVSKQTTRIVTGAATITLILLGCAEARAAQAANTGCSLPSLSQPVKHASASASKVAVTFDEHLGPNTAALLDTFERYDMTGTFFQLGQDVRDFPAKARRIVHEGHELANHSWNHARLTDLRPREISENLRMTNEKIREVTGFRPCEMRPPGLVSNDMVVKRANALEMTVVDATRGNDIFTNDPAAECSHALDGLTPGDILLFHQKSESPEALDCVLAGLQDRGYRSVPVVKLLGGSFRRAMGGSERGGRRDDRGLPVGAPGNRTQVPTPFDRRSQWQL